MGYKLKNFRPARRKLICRGEKMNLKKRGGGNNQNALSISLGSSPVCYTTTRTLIYTGAVNVILARVAGGCPPTLHYVWVKFTEDLCQLLSQYNLNR